MLELLQNTEKHPSADWIYDQLKREFPNLSMGTVYRNLNILMDQGLVRKLEFGSTFDRFDARTEHHYHFICEQCGKIVDLDITVDAGLEEQARKATGYLIRWHRIEFFGLCDECAADR
jgi:Fe2+ or Zn2+ uptake regulation protein